MTMQSAWRAFQFHADDSHDYGSEVRLCSARFGTGPSKPLTPLGTSRGSPPYKPPKLGIGSVARRGFVRAQTAVAFLRVASGTAASALIRWSSVDPLPQRLNNPKGRWSALWASPRRTHGHLARPSPQYTDCRRSIRSRHSRKRLFWGKWKTSGQEPSYNEGAISCHSMFLSTRFGRSHLVQADFTETFAPKDRAVTAMARR